MPQEKLLDVRKRLFDLERRIKPLEWDSSRNQINEFKKLQLAKLQLERDSLVEEMNKLLTE